MERERRRILRSIEIEVGSVKNRAYIIIASLVMLRQISRLSEVSLLIFCGAPKSALDSNPNAKNAQTIVTEWHLHDGQEWIPGFLQSMFYVGQMIGATLFGQLSDKYGRKIVGMTGYAVLLLNAASMGLTQNWQQLAVMRLVLGFLSCQYIADSILFQELCGRNLWAFNGILFGSVSYTLHTLLHIFTAYLFPNWRTLCFVDSTIGLLNFIYYYYIPESPRWLSSRADRMVDAQKVIERFETWNGKINNGRQYSQTERFLDQGHESDETSGLHEKNNDTKPQQRLSSLDLLREPSLRTRSLIMGLQWFTASFVYYCLTLGAGSFNSNFYLAHLISNLSSLPGIPLLMFLMERKWCGRRRTLAIFNFVAASSAFAMYYITFNDGSSTKLILLGIAKLGITLSFDLIYVYTPELFPTPVRNVGMGAMSTCARIGGIIAPFLAHTMVSNAQRPFILYGVICTTCGVSGLFLPETVGKKIPETMRDVHDQEKDS